MSTPTSPADEWSLPELTKQRRAIVVVDVVESVRLMQEDEAGFIDRWRRFVHQVRTEVLPKHGGRLVKSLGDGMLLEFERASQAVAAAFEMHALIARLSANASMAPPITLRTGLHVADIARDDIDLFGTGVNVASRVAGLALPGQTLATGEICEELVATLDAQLYDLGECHLKHITAPVRCFRLSRPGAMPRAALPLPLVQAPSLGVLPFTDARAETGGAIGQAIAEELIALLSRSDRLSVISRLSTSALSGRGLAAMEVAEMLGAHYLLCGTVHGNTRQLTLGVELVDAGSGHVLWADRLTLPAGDLLRREDGPLVDVASAAADTISRVELARATTLPLPNLDSYTLMVGGVTLMHRTGLRDFDRARELLEHLAERSGRHPVPHAWLAKWHVLRVQQGWSPNPTSEARAAIDLTSRALDADPDCSLAHTVEGFARANILREFDRAGECYERALAINPSDSLAWLLTGMLHAFQGRGDSAVSACDRARRLSPLDPLRYFYDALAASASLTAGRYDEAAELARASLRLNRSHLSTHRALVASLELADRHDEAKTAAQELMARDPGFTVSNFLARTPGRDFEVGQRVARALAAAGVPAGRH